MRTGGSRASWLLALALAAWTIPPPAAAAAARIDCAKAPRKALPVLLKRVLEHGDKAVIKGGPLLVVGWAAPTKMLLFKSEGETLYMYAIVEPGKEKASLVPTGLLLGRMSGSMVEGDKNRERQMYLSSVDGALEVVGIFYDQLDGVDPTAEVVPGRFVKRGPHDPRSSAGFASLLKALCPFAAKGLPSQQERLAAMKKRAEELKKAGAPARKKD